MLTFGGCSVFETAGIRGGDCWGCVHCPQPLPMGRRCLVGSCSQREERCESSLWLLLVPSDSQRETGFACGRGSHRSLTLQQNTGTAITSKSPYPYLCQALCNVHLLGAERDKENLPHAGVLGVSAWAQFLSMLSMQMSSRRCFVFRELNPQSPNRCLEHWNQP